MDIKEIKKKYSLYGLGLFVFVLVLELAGIVMRVLFTKLNFDYSGNSWLTYLFGVGVIWIVAFPFLVIIVHTLPTVTPPKHSIKPLYMLQFYAMMVGLMIASNLFGKMVVVILEKLSGLVIEDRTMNTIQAQDLLPSIVFVVILGPIMEEIGFRKILIDKLGKYSPNLAIILSGITFGLFHNNIHQFFYATAIGMLFAYIYSISGDIRYTIGLHMIVNLFHGILPSFILKGLDMDEIMEVSDMSATEALTQEAQNKVLALYSNPSFLLLLAFAGFIFLVAIVGIVLFLINVKKMRIYEESPMLPKDKAIGVVFFNPGMIAFYVLCLIVGIYTIILLQG